MNYSPDLVAVAQRVVWFENPEKSLRDPNRFLAYLMTHGTLDEIRVAKKHYSRADFEAALDNAPPGIFDPRSWKYWNLVYGRNPAPPLPERKIPGL